MAPETHRTALRRRNGRLQACDPCRSRKVACDHAQPVCLRCRRREQESECTYTASETAYQASRAPARWRIREPRASSSLGSLGSPTLSSPTHPATGAPAGSPRQDAPSSSSLPAPRNAGYLGFTSHSSLYQETSHRLSRLQGTPSTSASSPRTESQESSDLSRKKLLSADTLEACRTVLRNLLSLDRLRVIQQPRTPLNIRDAWAVFAAQRVMRSLEAYLCDITDDKDSRLDKLAKMLCENSARPMVEEAANVEEWLAYYIGPNLRWESIGLLFTYADQSRHSKSFTREGNRRESRGSPWRQFALRNLKTCIGLSKTFSDGSLLLLHIYHRWAILESVTEGDAVLSCWLAHSETVALLTFMGVHAEQETSSYVPTFTSELRRRLFANIFNLDKDLVSMPGRPPMLCHRYVLTPPPLDLDEEAFIGDSESFRAAVSRLDEQGWNTAGVVGPATLARGRMILSFVRNELLEVAVANKRYAGVDDASAVKKKAHDIIDELPPCLMYREEDIYDYSISYDVPFSRLFIRLEYLQNLLIAERLVQRRGAYADDGELLLIGFEMVVLTLKFWTHQDRFAGAINDFEGLLMGVGAPGGGVLSMELLKPTFAGPHHPRNPDISRSSIIQNLSLLVGFLEWVGPDAPNADLCANCRMVIQRVLDHTFNHAGTPMDGEQGIFSQQPDGIDHLLGGPVDGDSDYLGFGLDLLDTFPLLNFAL
ncbi:hypothetical protein B0I35DRAFT_444120 [Stachybotrys elegans]|uniref:Zn(2)-C6 fungal-type domain-containing protein n=1 Tax=Stachybotrys elegans TaxID=80388 RepID=A0A8K0WKR9_9HYPO|nr:hypothetical protein B0I35DRAFT_444120 [Stachybotrys elegans]